MLRFSTTSLRVRRARAERFGALVSTEEPAATLCVDRRMAQRLGVEGGPLWDGEAPSPLAVRALEGPVEVHVAVTDRCPAGCSGCYADARPDGFEPTFEELAARLRTLADMGTMSIAFGGGEATLHRDLPRLAELARSLGMVPSVTTSGLGIDAARARALRAMAQVNVSHDGVAGAYHAVRGYEGGRVAERAIAHLLEAGIPVGVNTVLTRQSFDALEETARHVEALGACELQLVRLKPAGRGRLEYLDRRLDPTRVAALPELLRRLSRERALGVRIDCAMVPFIAADPDVRLEDLLRFGVSGCEAGRSLLALHADGTTSGCSFARTPEMRGAMGWNDRAALDRFRDYPARAPEPCASCPVRPACRGGCRVVAEFVGGDAWQPDPECPRVRAARGSAPGPG